MPPATDFGAAVEFSDGLLFAGAPGTDSDEGAVYLIEDGGDSWGSVAAGDVSTIDGSHTGLTGLTAGDRFGTAVSASIYRFEREVAIGAPGADNGYGQVFVINDGKDDWGTIAAADIDTLGNEDATNSGIALQQEDRFGEAVWHDYRERVVVGAPGDMGKGGGVPICVRCGILFSRAGYNR